MTITINGEKEIFNQSELTVSELLVEKKVESPDMVSVEYNGVFLDRDQFPVQIVKDGDQIEFLYFMGGG